MAYRFNGTSDAITFSPAAVVGKAYGATTWAVLLKRNAVGAVNHGIFGIWTAANSTLHNELFVSGNALRVGFDVNSVGPTLASTAVWYLIVITKATGTSVLPRFHVHDGTSWTHADGAGTTGNGPTIGSGDKISVGYWPTGLWFSGDIVCTGIKNANSSDAAVTALSRTDFSTWTAFGFEWLTGFQASGTIVNRTAPGTGDETSRAGTTLVSDPPSWTWVALGPPVADFTATPLTGTAPLSVTFTDTSTGAPTSWLWDFGDGTTSTAQNPSHNYAAGGTYTVALTATNASGPNTRTRTAYVTATETIAYTTGGGVSIW